MRSFNLLVFVFFVFLNLACYIEHDESGLFYKFSEKNGGIPRLQVEFELKSGTSQDSLVFNIQNMEQFTRLVLKNSQFKPVVLKIYSPSNPDSEKVLTIFQAVAEKFKNSVVFAGLNVEQNKAMYMQISMFCRLKNVDLPLFMFYKNGQPIMPFLVGYQPESGLYGYIQRLFSSELEASE